MQLEDHAGDILAKARQAAGTPLEEAAALANVSPNDLAEFERTGLDVSRFTLHALTTKVALSPAKFDRIANGWLPQPRDLSAWRELRRITTSREGITVHCFLVWDEVSREGALFDTGWDAEPILAVIAENTVNLRHLFFTHTHDDHIAAMSALREKFPKLLLHTNSKNAPPQHRNRPNDFIHLGNLRITNREAPGHAEDGVIYVLGNWPEDAPHVAIIGDTLFAGSLATGLQSADLLKQKVRDQIFSLPNDTLLCPGHGPLTTVGEEKENNPFF